MSSQSDLAVRERIVHVPDRLAGKSSGVAVHTVSYSCLLSLIVVGGCSADRALGSPPTSPPHVTASIDLSSTGGTQLFSSAANAINDSGVVVGFARTTELEPAKAAVWRPPDYRLEILPDLSVHGSSIALAIGTDGTIAGSACETDNLLLPCHPVYWRAGRLHQLGGSGAVNSICPCDGYSLVGRVRVNGADHGALWVDDVLIDVGIPPGYTGGELRSISHGNVVGNGFVGVFNSSSAIAAYRWSPSTGWNKLESTIETQVQDVNSSGTAVGAFNEIWFAGANTESLLPANSFPSAINDSGVVAGVFDPTSAGTVDDFRPGTWSVVTGWVELGRQPKPTVRDINNAGLVVGSTASRGRSFAILWIP
jgi:hypothetical protein